MTQLPSAFNSNQYEDMNDFSTIPEAKYLMSIVKSELVLTKKAKDENNPSLGQMLSLQFKILAGKYKGKIVFVRLNIVNPNPTAVEIASKELATICRACRLPVIQDSAELHGIPMLVTVGIESSANYPDKNVATMYEPSDGSVPVEATTPTAQSGETAQTASAEPSAPKKRPWD